MSTEQTEECRDKGHLVVKDTFHQLTGRARAVPGDCWCVRCCTAVPFWWNSGKPEPVKESCSVVLNTR